MQTQFVGKDKRSGTAANRYQNNARSLIDLKSSVSFTVPVTDIMSRTNK